MAFGRRANQFTFVGVDPAEGSLQLGGHDFNRLPNGNVIIYDGGTADATRTSQVHEYQLDEQNKIATHVWTYIATEMTPNWARGSAQRLPNGNTFIGWGTCSDTNLNPPDCTEVAPNGSKVWEMSFNEPLLNSYRASRNPYPPSSQRVQYQHTEVASGNTYSFTNTGVTIDVVDRTGDGYNSATVAREPYASLFPLFPGKAPRLLSVRVTVSQSAIDTITGQVLFDISSFGITDPTNTTVYYRETPGQGLFVPLATQYNWVTHQLGRTHGRFRRVRPRLPRRGRRGVSAALDRTGKPAIHRVRDPGTARRSIWQNLLRQSATPHRLVVDTKRIRDQLRATSLHQR